MLIRTKRTSPQSHDPAFERRYVGLHDPTADPFVPSHGVQA